jgi:hypothetical protein
MSITPYFEYVLPKSEHKLCMTRSIIRTDADELTYNLHIMLRFDLELQLLEGKLRVKDLSEAWRAAMQADLGVAPADDRDGCLQDVHWYSGYIGGRFQIFLFFHKRLCGPIANSCFHHRPDPHYRPNSQLEAAYHRADKAIQKIVDVLAAA